MRETLLEVLGMNERQGSQSLCFHGPYCLVGFNNAFDALEMEIKGATEV